MHTTKNVSKIKSCDFIHTIIINEQKIYYASNEKTHEIIVNKKQCQYVWP